MLEFLKPGDTATTKGLFVGIPNLPNSFTEDYQTGQTIEYKRGRFILSIFQQISKIVSSNDFLNNPDETNKLGISLTIVPLRIDDDTEDRIINLNFIKVLDLKNNLLKPIDIGDPVDETFPTGLFKVSDLFPQGQLLNIGDQVSYAGAVIAESSLLANGLQNLTLSIDGSKFIEAFIKGIFESVPSQSGGMTSTLLPYIRPRIQIIATPLNNVTNLFDQIESLTLNIQVFFVAVTHLLTIRMRVTTDRTTVSVV
jgi:hypothetical protein